MESPEKIFSVGEKQLFCLARVMLEENRIVILDEATSNIDLKTDEVIQKCLKENFKNSLIIAVAHRLNTIADYDRLLVMDKGRIIENSSPEELYEQNGLFTEMVNASKDNS